VARPQSQRRRLKAERTFGAKGAFYVEFIELRGVSLHLCERISSRLSSMQSNAEYFALSDPTWVEIQAGLVGRVAD
jgi:hypothetical protein